jgi:hypothetical protein
MSNAQDSIFRCGVPDMDTTEFTQLDWFDNNQVLEDFLDSMGYDNPGARIMDGVTKYRIPVKFWIYRDDNGNGGPNLSQIQNMMDNLNRLYNGVNDTRIGFYMKCDPTYINNSGHLNVSLSEALILFATHSENGCINVHVVQDIHGNVVGFSVPGTNSVIVDQDSYIGIPPSSTLAHEIGHIFGLSHTHQYSAWNWKCFTECVSRTRNWPFFSLCFAPRFKKVCESTGDALKDTPADPNLLTNNSCNYTLGGTDPWGDAYPASGSEMPETTNIMSYNGNDGCINHFSRLQIAVMLRTIKWRKIDHSHWDDNSYIYDSYEPDNNSQLARTINPAETQERNFHRQFEYNGWGPTSTQCDVDWATFTANATGPVSITTSGIPNRTNADTRLTLYNGALTQLAQNDNISSGNLFSSISFNVTAGQTYFIQVENMATGTTSYYNLSLSCINGANPNTQISGSGILCDAETYTISNLPAGAAVQWQVSPQNIVTIDCPTCAQTSLTRINDGEVSLTATVNGCALNSFLGIRVGRPLAVESLTIDGVDPSTTVICRNTESALVAYPGVITTNTTYEWILPIDWVSLQTGTNTATTQDYMLSVYPGSDGTIYVRRVNECGNSAYYSVNVSFDPWCGNFYTISPNPATDNITIDGQKQKKNIKEVQIIDKTGQVKKLVKFGNNVQRVNVNVSGLASGVYYIKIFDGKEWRSKPIIIN